MQVSLQYVSRTHWDNERHSSEANGRHVSQGTCGHRHSEGSGFNRIKRTKSGSAPLMRPPPPAQTPLGPCRMRVFRRAVPSSSEVSAWMETVAKNGLERMVFTRQRCFEIQPQLVSERLSGRCVPLYPITHRMHVCCLAARTGKPRRVASR